MRRSVCIAIMVAFITSMLALPAVAFEIKSVTVKPSDNGVIVGVNYSLDPVTALKVLFFGAKTIENDVVSLFNTSNFTIIRIGYSHAEFLFTTKKFNNVTYFAGVNLSTKVNLTILDGVELSLGKVSRIPPIYFCGTFIKNP
jgi:hypothetical protein